MTPLIEDALAIAVSLNHPAYDCFYLALAIREHCSLVTADARFVAKLRGVATGPTWVGLVRLLSETAAA